MTISSAKHQQRFRLIPVLDILNGIVVRGIGGRREQYRPIESRLVQSHQPMDVACALRRAFGFQEFYLADLDAILTGRPNRSIYEALRKQGFELIIDAGIQSVDQALIVQQCSAVPIIGLESCDSPSLLREIVASLTCNPIFSLDLIRGEPKVSTANEWGNQPEVIVRNVGASGFRRIIVLDLTDVGTSSGGSTDELCRKLRLEFPEIELICGGGVRGSDDLRRLKSLGANGVLVASALHDGLITPDEIELVQTL